MENYIECELYCKKLLYFLNEHILVSYNKTCWKKYKILVAKVEHIQNLFWIALEQCDFKATY